MTDSSGTDRAKKNDAGKNMLAYIPMQGLSEIGKVMTYGATKYGAFNYNKGHTSIQLSSAFLRHVCDGFLSGEDFDPESGLMHLAHAGATIMILIQQIKDGTIVDDRPNLRGGK